MSDEEAKEDGALGYIMLDLVSCGLGSAILLGVILSITRYQAPSGVPTAPYLLVRLELKQPASSGAGEPADLNALPNLWIRPPGHKGFDLPIELFNLDTGRVRSGKELDPHFAPFQMTNSQFYICGFDRHGEGEAYGAVGAQRVPIYLLLITDPPVGDWEFRVRYMSRRDLRESITQIPRLSGTTSVFVADIPQPMTFETELITVGDLSEPPAKVTVKPSRRHKP